MTSPKSSSVAVRTPPADEPRALVTAADLAVVERLDQTAALVRTDLDRATGPMARSLIMARGVVEIRKQLTPEVMASIMPLMNTQLGFKTDRGPGMREQTPYSVDQVREAFAVSLLTGLYPVGQEWAIISGQCYVCLNGWKRKLEQLPGVSNIEVAPGMPRLDQATGHALVAVSLRWVKDGKRDELRDHQGKPGRVFTVQVFGRPAPDQLIGKAKAKAFRAAYEQAAGISVALDDEDTGGIAVAAVDGPAANALPSRAAQLAGHLGKSGTSLGSAADLLRRQCADLLRLLAYEPEGQELAALCTRVGCPANLADADGEQLTRLQAALAAEKADMDAASADADGR